MSASKKNHAVIFDIVLNIENLYSIGPIEEGMEIATTYYRYLGEQESIVNEHFQIIDEVRDCRVLFEKLNDTLTSSWELMYKHVKEYYQEIGDLEVPARYLTTDGYSLGKWIFNQRGIRKGTIEGTLTEEQIKKLDAIGMVWDKITDLNWSKNYEAAKAYFEEHGNLNISARYVTEDGVTLGGWLSNIRTWAKADVHQKYLTAERKAQLDAISMVWDVLDFFWENNFVVAMEYYRKYGNLEVASNYITPKGVRLSSWIDKIRKKKDELTDEQIEQLDQIGFVWEQTENFEERFATAKAYYEIHGCLTLEPKHCKTKAELHICQWLRRQLIKRIEGKLEQERIDRLSAIGMDWLNTNERAWERGIQKSQRVLRGQRQFRGKVSYVCVDGYPLGEWLHSQRTHRKRLPKAKLDALVNLGMVGIVKTKEF